MHAGVLYFCISLYQMILLFIVSAAAFKGSKDEAGHNMKQAIL